MTTDMFIQKAVDSKSLINLFEFSVESYPNKTAIFHNDQSITYHELNCQANAIAANLKQLEVNENSIVTILLERSINLIAAMLGVLKSGAAYTVIDPDYPISRIEYILNDTNSELLLTNETVKYEEKYKNLITSRTSEQIYISDLLIDSNSYSKNPLIQSTGDTLACVIYTSGSTGKPKGALLPHKAFFRLFNGTDMVQTSNSDCVAQIANASFDIAVYEIWAALGKGGTLVIIDKEIVLSPPVLKNYFEKYNVTTTVLAFGLFNQLLQTIPSIFKSFKNVIFGGEQANPQIIDAIINDSELKPQKLFNLYGPTECGVFTTYYEVKTVDANATSIPIGSSVNNTQIYILNEDLERVPVGAIGELYVTGDGLARGYLNLPDLTAQKFMTCPFDVNFKMYKTGDLVRMLPDGMIDFIGRKDNQVKIRGHRIELEEIESTLESHPEVSKAIALAPYTQEGHRQLVTYYLTKDNVKIEIESIKSHLRKVLPIYVIPRILIQLDSLPLTAHGKIDRKQLSEISLDKEIKTSKEPLNLNEVEETVLKIWKNILKIDKIQFNDNFFDLGGDSMMIMQMISQLAAYGITLSHSQILHYLTIESLSRFIENKKYIIVKSEDFSNEVILKESGKDQNNAIDISLIPYSLHELSKLIPDMKNVQAVYPLTPTQKGFLFHAIHDPKSYAYYIQTHWRVKGKYNAKAMHESWAALLSNRDIFRASYLWEELNDPIQIIYKKTELSLSEENWITLSHQEQEIRLKEYWQRDMDFGVDLKKHHLMRVMVIHVSDHEQLVIWSFHHIIMDGPSLSEVMKELDYYYTTLCSGQKPVLKQVASYRDYISWQMQYNQCDNKEFWEKYLDDFASPNQLSFQKHSYMDTLTNDSAHTTFDYTLSTELTQLLYRYSKDHNLTLNVVMQGMWAYLLSIFCNTLDVVFGLTVSTRPAKIKNVDSIAGPLINTVPFRVIIDKKMSVLEYFKSFQNNLAQVIDHSYYPYIDIQRDSQVVPGNGLFNSSFCFESQQRKDLDNKLSSFSNVQFNAMTHYPLSLYLIPGKPMVLKVNFDKNLYSKTDVDRLIDHYVHLLVDLTQKANVPLNQLSYLNPREFKQITKDWNQTDVQLPENAWFIDIFERQTYDTPQAIAIKYEDYSLSYSELNERANQLAHHLKNLGIKNNNLIGICLDRTPSMLTAILGVLKAGAAYIPLDPSYPPDRLNYIMEDSNAAILITSEKYDELISSKAKKINIDTDWFMITENEGTNPKRDIKRKDLAYVMYTSGSTGKPKGVMVHNLALFNYLYSVADILNVQKKCNAPVHTSFAFDATITSLFLPLFVGSTITLIPQENHIDGLYELIQSKEYYDIVTLTPAHLYTLGGFFESSQSFVKNVGAFVIGGEALSEKILENWRIIAPQSKFFNIYGPTETTVGSSLYDATMSDSDRTSVPIGFPIANTQYYVLDEYMQPVPYGIVGELYIGGFGVSNGYLNRPNLTKEKFISDKFSRCPHSKLFKTGDLACFKADGNLEFLGRQDDQVKVCGFRIELQEIESTLLEYTLIKEATVCVYKDISQKSSLVAYMVPRDEQELDIENIRNHLSIYLPKYMIPSYYITLDKLPLTVNGKVNRKLFPEPKQNPIKKASILPRNAREQKIANIWAKVLQKSEVGINENFFDEGGDSLNAIKLISQLRREFGTKISLRTIFESPTIIQLSSLL